MKAFVSVDLEGMPYIVNVHQLDLSRPLYNEARRIATHVTNVVVKELYNQGFERITIADSHGPMVNVLIDELPEYVEIIRGFPRPVSMVTGIEGSDAAFFLGYHARAGVAKSTFDHTYSGVIANIMVNGLEASEFLLNAYVAGYYGIPVVLVAGEEKLLEEVKERAPWVERVVLKSSFTKYSAKSPSFRNVERLLVKGVRNAVNRLKEGKVKPLTTGKDVRIQVTFTDSGYADVAELASGIRRVGGRVVEFSAANIIEAYKLLELLVLASMGLAKILR